MAQMFYTAVRSSHLHTQRQEKKEREESVYVCVITYHRLDEPEHIGVEVRGMERCKVVDNGTTFAQGVDNKLLLPVTSHRTQASKVQ